MSEDPNIGKVLYTGLTQLRITGVQGIKYTAVQTRFFEDRVVKYEMLIDRELIIGLKEQNDE